MEHVPDGRWPPGRRPSWQVPAASLSRIDSFRFEKGKLPGGSVPFLFFLGTFRGGRCEPFTPVTG